MFRQGRLLREILVLNMDRQLEEISLEKYGKELCKLHAEEAYTVVICLVKRLVESFEEITGEKKLYYISSCFEKRKFLVNNLCNLGIYELLESILKNKGHGIHEIEQVEQEYLGTGNLYGKAIEEFFEVMDGIGLPGEAIGIRTIRKYEDRDKATVAWEQEKSWLEKEGTKFQMTYNQVKAQSILYNMDAAGKNKEIYKYRIFDLEIEEDKLPEDKQIYYDYFLVSSGAKFILKQMREKQYDLRKLDYYAQIRFDHQYLALMIPEMIRIFVEEKAIPFKESVEIIRKVFGYQGYEEMLQEIRHCPEYYVNLLVPDFVEKIQKLMTCENS